MRASFNHIFRTIWSDVQNSWVVVSEITPSKGKSRSCALNAAALAENDSEAGNIAKPNNRLRLKLLTTALACCFSLNVQANPVGAQIVSGSAIINQNGNLLTVTNTPNSIINWQGFSIGSNETTRFIQQTASSSVLNRVVGADPSLLLGTLTSNGRVFLINQAGLMVGQNARINVAEFVASTLNLSNEDFHAGTLNFTATPKAGDIQNNGTITTPEGGTVYLVASQVENSGIINTPKGQTILAAGNTVQIVDTSAPGISVQITGSSNTATNLGKILADSGRIGMMGAAVNNKGKISANGIVSQGGEVYLKATHRVDAGGTISAQGVGGGKISILADKQGGTVNVTGTLDASAPNSGNGGNIETSAAHVQVVDTAKVTTASAMGLSGSWLIDPTDFTIGPAAVGSVTAGTPSGDISGATLSTALGLGQVTILSTEGSTGAGSGNINVNDVVSWSANKLTLNALNNININANLNGSGTASLALQYGQGAVAAGNLSTYNVNAAVSLPAGNNFSTLLGSNGAVTNYTVITSLGVATDATTAPSTMTLQGMAATTKLSGNYVLGSNINASGTSTWNFVSGTTYSGFQPIAVFPYSFSGSLDGLGHTISNLTINLPSSNYVGLFGYSALNSTIRNVGLTGGSISGNNNVGGLVGYNQANVSNSYSTTSVSGGGSNVGGLVGYNGANVSNSYSTASVNGNSAVGGLVGYNQSTGTVSNSYATGSVIGIGNEIGGLIGVSYTTPVNYSYAIGNVSGNNYVGGLVGISYSPISNSYATGNVSGNGYDIGGLTGCTSNILVSNSFATGSVSGISFSVGGLVGSLVGSSSITNSYATGNVNSNSYQVGGLLGDAQSSGETVSNSYATGSVTSPSSQVGGLVGRSSGVISNSYAVGAVSGGSSVGGLVGSNFGTINNSFYNSTVNPTLTGISGSADAGGIVWGMSTVAMQNSANFTNATGTNNTSNHSGNGNMNPGWGFTTTPGAPGWVIVNADGSLNSSGVSGGGTFPMLASEYSTTINNAHQLQLMEMAPAASYTLSANINALATGNTSDVWGSSTFVPIGNGTTQFTGTFDGLGHTISNLNINLASTNYLGLFGYSGLGSVISNVGMLGESITGSGTSMYVGGLIGLNIGGTISNSSASGGLVSGGNYVGGLVGADSGTIINSYVSSGSVQGNSNLGGLEGGFINTPDIVTNSYYDINTVLINGAVAVTRGGLYDDAPRPQFTDWLTSGLSLSIANFSSLTNVGVNSYTINSIQGLKDLQGFSGNAAYTFTLTSNIDLATGPAAALYIPYLAGTFNGSGFTISNLALNISANTGVGLIGIAATGSVVKNVVLTSVSVSGKSDVGGLVGYNAGSVSNSSVTGSVGGTGGSFIGGLVGENSGGSISNSHSTAIVTGVGNVGGLVGGNIGGSISNSYATGSVSGISIYVGGLAGYNTGTISTSYATGSVSGGSDVGGLVGQNYLGSISTSYATGSVIGGGGVGGLVGTSSSSTISTSYATGSVSGSSNVGGLVGNNSSTINNSFWNSDIYSTGIGVNTGTLTGTISGLTTAQMMQQTSFSGWNISNTGGSGAVWRIYEGNTTPLLTSFLTPLTLASAPDASLTYNGSAQSGGTFTLIANVLGAAATGTNVGFYNGYYSNQQGYDLTGGNLTITPANLTLSGVRSYDGTSIVSGSILTATGVAGQTFTVTGAGNTSNLASKNVQSNSILSSLTGLALGTSSNGGLSTNYNALSTVGSSVTVNPLAVTLTAPSVSKTYDGGLTYTTTAGNLTSLDASLVGGDTVTAATIAYANKNAGTTNKTVNLSGVTISDGNGGANYTVTLAGNSVSTINPLAVTLTAPSVSKTYDGGLTYTTTAGNLTSLDASLVGGDTVTAATIAYANKNAGTNNKTVNLSGVTISDGNGGANYTVTLAGNSVSTINPLAVTLTAPSVSKTYDGGLTYTTTSGNLTSLDASLVGGDTVTAATIAYTDKHAGTNNKTVNLSGVTISDGNGGANYTVTLAGNSTSTITTYMLNPSASIGGTLTKVYDGTTTATGATLSGTVTGIAGDSLGLNFTGVSLAYNGSHVVGTNVIVATGLPTLTINSSTALSAPTDYSYTAPTIANATASITPYLLTPTASIGGTLTKVYDGTTAATGATLSGTVTGIAGDSLSLNFTGVSLDYNGTHVVGTNAIVATGAPTLTINSPTALSVASDYTYIAPSITNATASITPAALSIVANSINKTYDGNAYSGGNGVIYAGFVNGEGVGVLGGTLAYSGTSQGAINSGSYVITPGGLTSSDYNIGFVNGVLTVNTPATIATIQQILSTNNTPSVAVTSNTSSSNVSAGPVNTTNSDSTNSTTTNGTSTNSVATNTDSTNTPSTVSIATNSTATNSDTTSTNSTTSTVTNSSPANSDSTNAASTTSVATNSDTTNATSTNNTTANSDTKNTDKKNTSSTNSTTTNNKDKPSAKLKKC